MTHNNILATRIVDAAAHRAVEVADAAEHNPELAELAIAQAAIDSAVEDDYAIDRMGGNEEADALRAVKQTLQHSGPRLLIDNAIESRDTGSASRLDHAIRDVQRLYDDIVKAAVDTDEKPFMVPLGVDKQYVFNDLATYDRSAFDAAVGAVPDYIRRRQAALGVFRQWLEKTDKQLQQQDATVDKAKVREVLRIASGGLGFGENSRGVYPAKEEIHWDPLIPWVGTRVPLHNKEIRSTIRELSGLVKRVRAAVGD